ncbi:MAG: calcium/sodium antiporter [Kiloniellales bacterium]
MAYLLAAGGLAILLVGGQALVAGATGLARWFGLSTLVIGLTVIAFGTSLPELLVAVQAAVRGSPGLTTGSVVGSNIANILLILGVGALVQPIACALHSVLRDGASLLAATALFTGFALTGAFRAGHGAVLLAALAFFMVWSYVGERRALQAAGPASGLAAQPMAALAPVPSRPRRMTPLVAVILVAAGSGALYMGSTMLIAGAVAIARSFAVPEELIGLTLIAVGTSLPELAAALTAGLRGEADLVLGNVVGSNIFNCLAVMGAAAVAAPIPVTAEILRLDIWIMVGASLLLIPVMVVGWRVSRLEGGILLLLYAGFLASHYHGGA